MLIRSSFLLILFISKVILQSNHDWLLYRSLPTSFTQYYDCLFLESIWYCRRPTDFSTIRISTSLCPEQNRRSFSELLAKNITAEELFHWSIPIDIIQTYANYLLLASLAVTTTTTTEEENMFICNCTNNRFGVNCEYRSPNMTITPAMILKNQLDNTRFISFYDQWCLTDITCNMGLSCLDWRYVCDGIEHCQFGEDEHQCELLEENGCDINEYRCRNGMCIPQEWFFDSEFDCQDESDEHRLDYWTNTMKKCPFSLYTIDCAENFCHYQQPFSCGDGQCLRWQDIHDQQNECSSRRDLFHRCESGMKTTARFSTTENNGSCELFQHTEKNLTEDNLCTKAFRKLLAGKATTIDLFKNSCDLDFDFPRYPFFSSNVYAHYNRTIVLSSIDRVKSGYGLSDVGRKPHYYCFSGSITCSGIVITLNQSFCLSSHSILNQYDQWPFHYIVCSRFSVKSHLIKSFNLWQCRSNQRLISKWRINDGYKDCFNGEDELVSDFNESWNRPYRYRCSSSIPLQYVSTVQLGDKERNCQDGSDEISPVINWKSQQCIENDLYTCEILRNDAKINQVRLRFHHYCNSVWDTWNGNDERNCTKWKCSNTLTQCNQTGQCIKSAWRCDGEWDCTNGEDELNCPIKQPRISLENKCNNTKEFFCITLDFIHDPTNYRPCIHYSQVGDDRKDCLGAYDERNTIWCRDDNQMLGNRFQCANGSCLESSQVCDGIKDCKEGADEQLCYWIEKANQTCPYGKFQCLNGTCISSARCNTKEKCSDNEHLLWCPRWKIYRGSKSSWSNYEDFCMGTKDDSITLLKVDNDINAQPIMTYATPIKSQLSSLICNQGLIIAENTSVGQATACFCPPNHYGDRCQYFSRRIPVRIRLNRLHRTDLNKILHIYIFLICNQSRIMDYTQFIDSIQNLRMKHDQYLLYSRPKLSCDYSVQIEIFDVNISNVRLLSIWKFSIHLDFLPSQRLAKILHFPLLETHPIPLLCTHSICQNNGTCHIIINRQRVGDSYCECQLGFYGPLCQKRIESCPCLPPAKCRAIDTETNDTVQEWFCICPEGLLPPYCLLKNIACLSNPCQHNGTCYPHSEVGYYTCICDKQYRGIHCEIISNAITIYSSGRDNIVSYFSHAFLLQLFSVRRGFIVLRQQALIHPSQLPLTIFFESDNTRTELGFIQKFEREISSVTLSLHLLYANCTVVTNHQYAINILDSIKCENLIITHGDNIDVRQFHDICRNNMSISCFYTSYYFCRCDTNLSRAECVSFHSDLIECQQKAICLNDGQCIQGDRRNSTDFICICPLCTRGKLCQYTSNQFIVSLETLLVSIPLSNIYHLIVPISMFIFGLIFNGISIIIFYKILTSRFSSSKLSFGGCSVYLLMNSIISQLTLTFLLFRIIYLLFNNVYRMSMSMNVNFCKILPYIMSSTWCVSSWIIAFVTATRSLSIVRPKSWSFIRSSRFAIRIVLITILIIFLIYITYILSYKIVDDTMGKQLESWCVLEPSVSRKIYLQLTTLIHQIIPFKSYSEII